MRKLYKFHWDCGRMGSITAIFPAGEEEVEAILGKKVNFGEVLGKHSEISGTLEKKDFKVITDDQDFITKFDELSCDVGPNPLNYLPNEGEEI